MTVLLTGLLPFVILAASVLALPVSFVLLRLYRRAVQRGMWKVGAITPEPGSDLARRAPASPLIVKVIELQSIPPGSSTVYRAAASGPWRAAGVYAMGGAAYAAVMTAAWLIATRDPAVVWTKILLLFWTYFWPAALGAVLIAGVDRTTRLKILGGYFLVLFAVSAIISVRNPDLGVGQPTVFWAIENGPATALVMIFLLRSLRAAGPLVLTFLVIVALGSQALLMAASTSEPLLRTIAGIGFALGLSATLVFAALIAIGMMCFGLLGWPLLGALGRRYHRKRFSDQSITLDSIWLLFGVVGSIGLVFEGAWWAVTGLVAFAAFKLTTLAGFHLTRNSWDPGQPTTLLLLRVFSLGSRSERLFDSLRKHWQYAGSISMIAGPDLVTTTVEPDEFLAFVGGRLGRQFVGGRTDLEQRTAAIDRARDPDGRYRVNEFFCRNDTWQPTMERLAAMSDAVLMDLRSFSPANQGCIFELARLLDRVDLQRVVFLTDATTDRGFLEATLQDMWSRLDALSPNGANSAPAVRLFPVTTQSARELLALLRVMMQPAPSGTAVAVEPR
jgi:hypothetical protein